MTAVELTNLGASYDGEQWALRNLSFEVARGSLFGLIGPNGAGKSTTLRAIAGLRIPDEGQVLLDGFGSSSHEFEERKRSIGFLGDRRPLYRRMSVREYLEFFALAHGVQPTKVGSRVSTLLDKLDLKAKKNADCSALSKGMQQRLCIGRALVHQPSLLILDEPADGLDPQSRLALRDLLRELNAEGTTIIVSSHILRELDDLCDHVAILNRGSLARYGAVDDILRDFDAQRPLYRLSLLSDSDRIDKKALRDIAKQCAVLVTDIRKNADRVELGVECRDKDPQVAQLVQAMVRSGYSICGVTRDKSRLEDVYDAMTDHGVN